MATASTARKTAPVKLSSIKKKINTSLIIDSRSLYNKLSNQTDNWLSKNWHNVDVANLQSFSSLRLFKLFAANDSSYSAALTTHLRMMVDTFRITAYKNNDSIYEEGQKYIDELKHQFTYKDKWAEGFSLSNTINDQISQIARNILTSDHAAASLFIRVDPDTYEIDSFKVIDCDRVHFTGEVPSGVVSSGNAPYVVFGVGAMLRGKNVPFIYEKGQRVVLDIANFLWQPLDSDAEQITGNNPLRPVLRNTFTKLEFLDNLRKVLKNQAWPKVKVVLDEEAVLNLAPPDVRADKKKLIEFFNDYLEEVEEQLTNIQVDQNIVVYDTIKEISFLESRVKFDPRPIMALLDAEQISSLKAPPSTVGKGGSTRTGEGLASAELVVFRRTVKALRTLVETLYSRAFTLALRLRGLQGYVKFRLNEFSLRPPEESAQFNNIQIDSIERSWILGAIGDDEMHRKIRQIHNLEGKPPADAKLREDLMEAAGKTKQTERLPDAEREKEERRNETRKNQKTGNDRNSTQLPENNDFMNLSNDIPFYIIKKDKIDWKKLYKKDSIHWADNMQSSRLAQKFAQSLIEKNKKSILEIGCGAGQDSILFALAKLKVTAIDIIPEAIEIAKENAKNAEVNIDFQVGTAEELLFKDKSFDAIFTLSVLHSTNINKSIAEIHRVLKNGGISLIHFYSNVEKIDNTTNEFVSVDEHIDLLKNNKFNILNIYTNVEKEFDEAGEKHLIIVSEIEK